MDVVARYDGSTSEYLKSQKEGLYLSKEFMGTQYWLETVAMPVQIT